MRFIFPTSMERHTGQVQSITGMPTEVPVPRNGNVRATPRIMGGGRSQGKAYAGAAAEVC